MRIKGKIVKGVNYASGGNETSPYLHGTIFLQRLAMKEIDGRFKLLLKKLDKLNIFNGTINIKIKKSIVFQNPDFLVKDLLWFNHTFETFAYIKARIIYEGQTYDCLIYRPQPSVLSIHKKNIVEILAEKIPGLDYGKPIELVVAPSNIKNLPLIKKIKLWFKNDENDFN